MKYKNANEVLPDELIKEIQKYTGGTLLYIPKPVLQNDKITSACKKEPTDFQQYLMVRNQRIFNEHKQGKNIGELMEKYYLSLDTIKKIVYGKQKKFISFEANIENAKQYTERGLSEEWIRSYLHSKTGTGSGFDSNVICDGLLSFPLRLIDEIKNPDYDTFENEPLIIKFVLHKFICYTNKNWIENLKNQRRNSFPSFVIIENKEEYHYYYENYGKPFSKSFTVSNENF